MPSRFFRRSRAIVTGLALCGAATAAVLPATSGAASAAQVPSTGATATATATAITGYYNFSAASDGLYLNVQGGSAAKDALIVQWTQTGTTSEIWHVGRNGQIRNLNSNKCLTTNGNAGGQLYQWPCLRAAAAYQGWVVYPAGNGFVSIVNTYFGLYVDVYQDNFTLGGPVDAWPDNGGYSNQQFAATPVTVDSPKG